MCQISDQDLVTDAQRATPVILNFEKEMGLASQEVLDEFPEKFNCYNYGAFTSPRRQSALA